MAKHVSYKCPHCKKKIRSLVFNSDYTYGSPVRTCLFCNKLYIDRYYKEIAIEGINEADKMKVPPVFVILIALGAISLIFGILSLADEYKSGTGPLIIMGTLMLLLGIVTTIFRVFDHEKNLAHLKELEKESYERMKSKQYLRILKASGYDIPEEFFDKASENESGQGTFAAINTPDQALPKADESAYY